MTNNINTIVISNRFKDELDEALEINKPDFKYDAIYFYYLAELVDSANNKGIHWIYLSNKMLKAIYRELPHYLNYLVANGFILRSKSFRIGVKSYSYLLNSLYKEGYTRVNLNNQLNKHINKKRAEEERLNKAATKPHLRKMSNQFNGLDYDYEGAYKYIDELSDKTDQSSYIRMIDNLKDRRYFKRNTTNFRLDTNLTGMLAGLRQFIKGNYCHIDLSNSQPFLLAMLLKAITEDNSAVLSVSKMDFRKAFGSRVILDVSTMLDLEELKRFSARAAQGTLYNLYINSQVDRKESKDNFFKVLYSRNLTYTKDGKAVAVFGKEKKIFAYKYPSIAKALMLLKRKDHRNLSIYMQRLESFIFIDNIAKELVEEGIIPLTVHDSVIIKNEDSGKAQQIIKTAFIRYFGEEPNLKVDFLTLLKTK